MHDPWATARHRQFWEFHALQPFCRNVNKYRIILTHSVTNSVRNSVSVFLTLFVTLFVTVLRCLFNMGMTYRLPQRTVTDRNGPQP